MCFKNQRFMVPGTCTSEHSVDAIKILGRNTEGRTDGCKEGHKIRREGGTERGLEGQREKCREGGINRRRKGLFGFQNLISKGFYPGFFDL